LTFTQGHVGPGLSEGEWFAKLFTQLRESNSSFYREWVAAVDCSVASLESRIRHGWKQVPDTSPFNRQEVALVQFPADDLNLEGKKTRIGELQVVW
jgi:hypothetical protein